MAENRKTWSLGDETSEEEFLEIVEQFVSAVLDPDMDLCTRPGDCPDVDRFPSARIHTGELLLIVGMDR